VSLGLEGDAEVIGALDETVAIEIDTEKVNEESGRGSRTNQTERQGPGKALHHLA
jgi:hypothetical protein